MHRVLITGSRDWTDVDTMVDAMRKWWNRMGKPKDVTVVHGACPTGADQLCIVIANAAGFEVESHPADWKTFGKSAGFVRNQHMVDLGADVCLAFIKDESKGATGCSNAAIAAGIPTYIWRE